MANSADNAIKAYLCEQDGQDPAVRKKGIMEYLREAGSRHTRNEIS